MRAVVSLLGLLLFGLTAAQAPVEGAVERPDTRLHYRVYGTKGPYVMILSGGPGGAVEMLQPFADHLKDRFRCVMLEQRGTGRSKLSRYDEKTISFETYIEDIEAVREDLKQEKVLLVGSSWGMTLALAYAAAHPRRVLAVATVGSGNINRKSIEDWQTEFNSRLTRAQKQAIAAMSERDLSPDEGYVEWLQIVMPAYFYKPEAAARFASAVKAGDINGRIPGPANRMMRRLDEYVYDALPRISAPVLLVQGKQDLAPAYTAEIVRERVRGSKIVMLDECGHMPWLDQPTATWKALDAFLSPFASR